jgi:nicotinate-nucleotide adenylyltransferase
MKVGLFFGSFDPPHVGHTIVAEFIIEAMEAEEIWMVISPQNPFKKEQDLSDEKQRFELVRKALNGHEKIKPCDHEFKLERPSYTIDTLKSLKKDHPEKEFFLIMGSDNLLGIKNWKDYQKILDGYEIAVYPRPGHEVSTELLERLKGRIQLVDAPVMELSSTDIRARIRSGKVYRMKVKEAVWRSIERDGLYR